MKKNAYKKINSRLYKDSITPDYLTLLKNLDSTKEEITHLNSALNFVTDPILLNQLIFQIKAAEVRYQYWFLIARNMESEISEKAQTNV